MISFNALGRIVNEITKYYFNSLSAVIPNFNIRIVNFRFDPNQDKLVRIRINLPSVGIVNMHNNDRRNISPRNVFHVLFPTNHFLPITIGDWLEIIFGTRNRRFSGQKDKI